MPLSINNQHLHASHLMVHLAILVCPRPDGTDDKAGTRQSLSSVVHPSHVTPGGWLLWRGSLSEDALRFSSVGAWHYLSFTPVCSSVLTTPPTHSPLSHSAFRSYSLLSFFSHFFSHLFFFFFSAKLAFFSCWLTEQQVNLLFLL